MLLLNIFSIKLATRFLAFASSFKLLVITIIVVLGLWKTIQNGMELGTTLYYLVLLTLPSFPGFPEDMKEPFAGSATSLSSVSLGLYGVLYGYDGWYGIFILRPEEKGGGWDGVGVRAHGGTPCEGGHLM